MTINPQKPNSNNSNNPNRPPRRNANFSFVDAESLSKGTRRGLGTATTTLTDLVNDDFDYQSYQEYLRDDNLYRPGEDYLKTTLTKSEKDHIRRFHDVYPPDELIADIVKIRRTRHQRIRREKQDAEYRKLISEGRTLEQSLLISLDPKTGDLFKEDFFVDSRNPQNHPIHVEESSDYDDWYRHADLICTIQNDETDGEPLIFAIDTTLNADKLDEKFSNGEHRTGIQGFTDLRYYDGSKTGLRSSRQDDVPLFIVGYSKELAGSITASTDSEKGLNYRDIDYTAPLVVEQIQAQIKDNLARLDQQLSSSTNHSTPSRHELESCRQKLTRLERYFNEVSQSIAELESEKDTPTSRRYDSVASAIANYGRAAPKYPLNPSTLPIHTPK